jgi:hypothetical protein
MFRCAWWIDADKAYIKGNDPSPWNAAKRVMILGDAEPKLFELGRTVDPASGFAGGLSGRK